MGWRDQRQPIKFEKENDLEVELQSHLSAAFSATNARGNAKVIHRCPRARRGPERNAAKAKIRAIEDIEEFRPKFDIDGFRNSRPLDKAHAVTIDVRVTQFAYVGR